MYSIYVPVINANVKRDGREKLCRRLNDAGIKNLLLALDCYPENEAARKHSLDELADNCRYFKEQGFYVGTWIWSFWVKGQNSYEHQTSLHGVVSATEACPADPDFLSFTAGYFASLASTGVDLILLDDDYRLGFYGDYMMGCFCRHHRRMIGKTLGEEVSIADFADKALFGGPNKYRDAFLKANGDSLRNFAKVLRDAVNTVNPAVRLGVCSCLSAWDADGTNSVEISRILAGDTKPFLRLIGAPYWAAGKDFFGRSLMIEDVIELERMELSWVPDDIEVISEGDTYPRPRVRCPSAYLEGMDTALRADGSSCGMLKYMIDYTSGFDYETYYLDRHIKSGTLYEKIDELFTGKENTGIRVYETMAKLRDSDIPEKHRGDENLAYAFFSRASEMLAEYAIPTCYRGIGVTGIALGENVRALTKEQMKNGLIIDASAAMILQKRGIDCGYRSFGNEIDCICERYLVYHDRTAGSRAYDAVIDENAVLLSVYETDDGREIPAAFTYENADGIRFLVFNVDASDAKDQFFRNYYRAEEIIDSTVWLSGKPLPAYTKKNNDLYIQCKEKDGVLAVGLWNFTPDAIDEPEVFLGIDTKKAKLGLCINTEGRLSDGVIKLSRLEPFGFCAFEIDCGGKA